MTNVRLQQMVRVGTMLAILALPVFAQRVQFGPILGISPSPNFQPRNVSSSPARPSDPMPYRSATINYIGGFSAQGNITAQLHWSADILIRRLRYTMTENPFLLGGTRQWVDTFQFPLLLRYTVPGDGLRPFLEAGPSFRIHSADVLAQPSATGFTTGAGLFIPLGSRAFAPRMRYTRWSSDSTQAIIPTKRDQIEVLVGFTGDSTQTPPRSNPRVMLGAAFGAAIGPETVRVLRSVDSPIQNGFTTLSQSWSQSRWVGGPSLHVRLGGGFSTEVNALVRDARLVTGLQTHGDAVGAPSRAGTTRRVHMEVPVLGQYRLSTARVQPFVLGGASFAKRDNRFGAQAANIGFTSGAGLDFPYRGGRMGGQFRYTRWGSGASPLDSAPQPLTGAQLPRNDLYLLFTIMY